MKELRMIGADDTMLCEFILQHSIEPYRTTLVLSASKKAEIALRDQMTETFGTFVVRPQIRSQARTDIAFDNDSRIFFRVARTWAGCGLAMTMLVINDFEHVKKFDELRTALYPCLMNGRVIINSLEVQRP